MITIRSGYYRYAFLCAALILLLLPGCKKDFAPAPELGSTGSVAAEASIPSYNFDWEAATYMPSLPNANLVPMPWNSGTNAIDPNMVADYHRAHGWELVWNSFSPTVQLNDPGYSYYFALYNRYRGVLRFYLWQQGTAVATDFVNHGLRLYGATNSPLLNYNAREIADFGNHQTTFNQVLNQSLTLSGGKWLVFQYDMAYDPNLATTSFPNFGLEWDAKWASVSQITLNGGITGTINGTVGFPASNGPNFGQLFSNAFATIYGGIGAGNFLSLLTAGKYDYNSALNNLAGGVVKDFLTGMATPSIPPTPIQLNINAKVKVDGTLTTNGGIINKKLVMPGQANSQTADGLTPVFNNVMGVVGISGPPIVNAEVILEGVDFVDPWDNIYTQWQWFVSHSLDNSSYTLLWNPAIINSSADGASVQNLQVQIIKTHVLAANNGTGGIHPFPIGSRVELWGAVIAWEGYFQQIERSGTLNIVAGYPNSNIPLKLSSADDDNTGLETGVRVSFDVVPNNGGPVTKMVKTFKANVIKHRF